VTLGRLAWRNITGSSFRSTVVFLCALVVAGLALSTVLIVRGARDSLSLAMDRLGADIIVVPAGGESKVESALLMGGATKVSMSGRKVAEIAAVPGVAAVSPQLYLSSLSNASCCSFPEMLMVAYEPETDFTLRPWLQKNLPGGLKLGEAVGGAGVFIPPGEQNIRLYGYILTLKGNLQPTGTNLDRTMFFTFETARDIARISKTLAEQPLEYTPDIISAALVKVAPGQSAQDVAVQIFKDVPDVTPIESPNLFLAFRKQISGLMGAMLAVLAITTVLSLVLVGLVFSMAANERRREMGVLRALGGTRNFVFRILLSEAALLALAGAVPGLLLAAFSVYLFRNLIIRSIGVPFLYPSPLALLALIAGGVVLALVGVTLAASLPAYRISRLDAAVAMRE
jgi:putative ABC transport system permease protein